MPRTRVTCPETSQLEQIDHERHPLGALIRSCTGCPSDQMCSRMCAVGLDRQHGVRALRLGTVLLARSLAR